MQNDAQFYRLPAQQQLKLLPNHYQRVIIDLGTVVGVSAAQRRRMVDRLLGTRRRSVRNCSPVRFATFLRVATETETEIAAETVCACWLSEAITLDT